VRMVPIDSNVASSNIPASLKPRIQPRRSGGGRRAAKRKRAICAQEVWPPASAQRVGGRFTALRSSRSVPLCLCRHRALEICSRIMQKIFAVRCTPGIHMAFGVGMRLSRVLFLAALAGSSAQGPGPASPDSQATLRYIHAAWDSLTHSVTDCAALPGALQPGG
jgi:hypothetical protein